MVENKDRHERGANYSGRKSSRKLEFTLMSVRREKLRSGYGVGPLVVELEVSRNSIKSALSWVLGKEFEKCLPS